MEDTSGNELAFATGMDDDCSLDLSYNSSTFESDELDDIGNLLDVQTEIIPYQFEPYDIADDDNSGSDSGSDSLEVEQNRDRLLTNDWCTCGNCDIMPTAIECVCCKEIQQVNAKIEEFDGDLQCISRHPGFASVCLDVYVLETAYYQYRQMYGEQQMTDTERNRYTAYRQLARWCWGYLGKNVRVPLPACSVNMIRQTFPSQNYRGFQSDS